VFGGTNAAPAVTTGIAFHSAGLPTLPAAGCPATAGAYNWTPAYHNAAAYGRDAFGIVHLRGAVALCGYVINQANTVFTLPAGYRPGRHEVPAGEETLEITPSGLIEDSGHINSEVGVYLDGITFRCAPSGVNGCP
jgi:hypothetical protein